MGRTCPIWGITNYLWKNSNWTWAECILTSDIVEYYRHGVDASKITQIIPEDVPWIKNLEKKKRLIRLICKVRNEKYNEEKEVRNIKIKIDDVKLVVKKVLGVELTLKD